MDRRTLEVDQGGWMSVLEWQMVKERQKSMIDAWAKIHRQLCGNALGELDMVEGR